MYFTPGSKMDLYARAAATLYGIISFDDFCKIMDVYYGEGVLSKDRIMAYFWTSDNDDPVYYIQDELIVHASIFPYEISSTLLEIQQSAFAPPSRCYKVLPQQEFLMYANPFFYEDCYGTRQMKQYLTGDLGIPQEDVEEIVEEMVFICGNRRCVIGTKTPRSEAVFCILSAVFFLISLRGDSSSAGIKVPRF